MKSHEALNRTALGTRDIWKYSFHLQSETGKDLQWRQKDGSSSIVVIVVWGKWIWTHLCLQCGNPEASIMSPGFLHTDSLPIQPISNDESTSSRYYISSWNPSYLSPENSVWKAQAESQRFIDDIHHHHTLFFLFAVPGTLPIDGAWKSKGDASFEME